MTSLIKPRHLTVLGSSGCFPTVDNPCASYLVTWDAFTFVVDLGYDALPALLARVAAADLDAVLITHEHPDHYVDCHALLRQLCYGEDRYKRKAKLQLYGTQGVVRQMLHMEPDLPLDRAVEVHVIDDGVEVQVGPFVVSGVLLPHWVPNIGVRMCPGGVPVVGYTGDTGPSERLAALGADVGLFVVDATDQPGETDKAERNLMTPEEAARWAARAGARRLLLTHFWPGNDVEEAVARAEEHFKGEVLAARPGLVVEQEV